MADKQRVFTVEHLPADGLAAGAAFFAEHLAGARAVIEEPDVEALAIVLPPADPDHTDWRRSVARDLARAYTPKRVNVVAGEEGAELDALLAYLGNAPGVTGHYCEVHDQGI